MAEWKVEINEISFSNRRFRLETLKHKIKPGTITGIIGKNGSGKSTLLKLIHGDIKPHSGEILIDGKAVSDYSPWTLSRKISFLYQEMYEPFSFTVRDVMNVSGYSREESVSSYMSALEELGIAPLSDVQFTSLSGGERRLATIAASIYQDAEVMLFDEPTTYLDIDNQVAVHEILGAMKERGKTIIIVMHDINAIQSICDEVIMLRSGIVVASGPTADVINEENLRNAFDITFREFSYNSEKIFVHTGFGKT